MAILPILCYPDPRLLQVAKPVQAVDARIKALVADMLETMYDAQGIGLAATQVDVHERLVVIDVSEERNEPLVLINPEIVWASAEKHLGERYSTNTLPSRWSSSCWIHTASIPSASMVWGWPVASSACTRTAAARSTPS